jgi:hypothetical protein
MMKEGVRKRFRQLPKSLPQDWNPSSNLSFQNLLPLQKAQLQRRLREVEVVVVVMMMMVMMMVMMMMMRGWGLRRLCGRSLCALVPLTLYNNQQSPQQRHMRRMSKIH